MGNNSQRVGDVGHSGRGASSRHGNSGEHLEHYVEVAQIRASRYGKTRRCSRSGVSDVAIVAPLMWGSPAQQTRTVNTTLTRPHHPINSQLDTEVPAYSVRSA